MDKVVMRTTLHAPNRDREWWLSRPPEERFAAVEELRRQAAKAAGIDAEQRLQRVAELLGSTGVEFLVVGGYALAAHGHPRYTGDLDLWIDATPDNVRRLLTALRAFGFGSFGLHEADFLQPGTVIQLGYPPSRIDLLTSIDGVTFADCYPRRVPMEVGGVLPIIDLGDFKANKRAAGRAKDLADLESLEGSAKNSNETR